MSEPTGNATLARCERCRREIPAADMKWKCCPDHTSERGADVMCEPCAKELHSDL